MSDPLLEKIKKSRIDSKDLLADLVAAHTAKFGKDEKLEASISGAIDAFEETLDIIQPQKKGGENLEGDTSRAQNH